MAKPPKAKGNLFVGTSGWSYGTWTNFYPEDLPKAKYLAYYSEKFPAVELNYSFYHLPRTSSYEKWAAETRDEFRFSLKLSRFITHIKRLKGVKVASRKFLRNALTLGPKLGAILVQMPPSFKIDPRRLDEFLRQTADVRQQLNMRPPLLLAFEFRHPTWFDVSSDAYIEALDVLRRHQAAFVFAHSSRYPYPENEPLTAPFVYLRFHGPGKLFASQYGQEGLERWAPKVNKWLAEGRDVYAYFNNDVQGYAVADAQMLRKLAST